LAVSYSTLSLAAGDQTLKEAENLIRKGDFNAAYQLLEPLESARAGDIDYDYLLGVAGVESGNATRGAFALERVLALDPNHKEARTEMAKAHFILGETDASKAEFNNVLQQNPNAETKRVVEKALNAIDKIEGTTTTFGAYLEFGLGNDSNVSSAPGITSVSVPVFGGALLDLGNSAKEQSDNFMSMAAGISFRQPVTTQLAVFGAASGNRKINGSELEFDTSALDFNAGLQYRLNQNNNFTLALQDNHFDLNDEAFRRAYGTTVQWLHNIDASNQSGLYAQYSRLKFIGNEFRNAERSIIGINGAHVFKGDFNPVVFGGVYGGREDAFSTLAAELRDNDEQDPAFLKKRKDKQYDVSLGLNFIPARDWSIKPQITYTKNDSNIVTNDFDRTIISVTARKDFSW
jgi:outer membrane protein